MKHPDSFQIFTEHPINGSPDPETLPRNFYTPKDLFFVRNHGDIPEIDPDTYRLSVEGLVETPLELTLDDLKNNYSAHEVSATLMCAGNRRVEMEAVAPIPGEIIWDIAAISNASWRGARLVDILTQAGITKVNTDLHVDFLGLDEIDFPKYQGKYGGSIPLDKALNSDVLLAYEMNGQPLPATHGFPIRVVVPGYIGARSVKWLGRVRVQETPSDNFYQTKAYKLFSPETTPETADWSAGKMLGEQYLNAIICSHTEGQTVDAGKQVIQGIALPHASALIERVEVSIDNGTTWQPATLDDNNKQWSWRLWSCEIDLAHGQQTLIVRAFDNAGNSQPETVETVWNFKGYMNNAWHRVNINVR